MFVVHNKRGDMGLEAATFGEAQYIAICLGMHREDVSLPFLVIASYQLTPLVVLQSQYASQDSLLKNDKLIDRPDRISETTKALVHALQC
jgi:hypothetical protein